MLLRATREAGKRLARSVARARASQKQERRDVRARRAEAGFTLVEILVVITIIGLIMGLVGPRVLTYLSDSKVKAAGIQIQGLSSALDLYYLDSGRYPTSNEGLSALVQRPGGVTTWNGPYLKGNAIPNDPWGRPYVYKVPGQQGPFEIVTLGPDGRGDDPSTVANASTRQ